jgi:hypothetical protein
MYISNTTFHKNASNSSKIDKLLYTDGQYIIVSRTHVVPKANKNLETDEVWNESQDDITDSEHDTGEQKILDMHIAALKFNTACGL